VAEERSVSEPADLVDVFYRPLVRPLGNLVVLFAQAERRLLELVVELTGCTEKAAQQFLTMDAIKVRQEIVRHALASGIEGFRIQDLSGGLEGYYKDRERGNRLIHDEWFVSLFEGGKAKTQGLPRKKDAEVVWDDSTPDDVWDLALRFRDYEGLFCYVIGILSERKSDDDG
jgi:hypothetical protein